VGKTEAEDKTEHVALERKQKKNKKNLPQQMPSSALGFILTSRNTLLEKKKKKKIYLPSESHVKLNQINAKGGLPEEQTLINAGSPYNLTIVYVTR